MQLVGDCVTMYDTMKDKPHRPRRGDREIRRRPPEKVIEVQSLIGDSTDNVPGVPGIGVKTAAQLIGEYGDLETLLKRAKEIKQDKRRQTLIDNAEMARISKRLVTLDQNVRSTWRSTSSRCMSRITSTDRVPQGDGVQHHDASRRRGGRDRRQRSRGG